ncbi:cupin domain-containing protein [Gordonia jinghuaiqii]|uniref:Cupin domain-containing protein n=1 Tax=Gordonia jinghuaiqii TaxID=2758710 RepID=A0A7D7LP83_9ACTN|nr:cupin domain-containing protein [Gordonia jinghuaiqii]MCR5976698.1 cupin domain-containing protein [Gordonia jinghuaiqii]QMS99879.1 cupin domain-containing protein [Gordonia jinghuaiqii]
MAGVLAGSVLAAPAQATPPQGGLVRQEVARFDIPWGITPGYDGPSTVIVQQLVIPPGASTGWHTHPGPEYSIATGGNLVLRTSRNCRGIPFAPGGFMTLPSTLVHEVVNMSPAFAWASVTYTVRPGAPDLVDAANPCAR